MYCPETKFLPVKICCMSLFHFNRRNGSGNNKLFTSSAKLTQSARHEVERVTIINENKNYSGLAIH